jgi:hypothetical protein
MNRRRPAHAHRGRHAGALEALLSTAFVDVRDGDEPTGVYLPGNGMRLYDRQRLLAELNDEALARAFFDIWLTRQLRPTLRLRRAAPP